MRLLYLIGWATVSGLIFFCVGLAFLPHTAACLLTTPQKFLSNRASRHSTRGAK